MWGQCRPANTAPCARQSSGVTRRSTLSRLTATSGFASRLFITAGAILAAWPQVLQCYLDWKNTTARTPISERRLAASVGVIITALEEVLPTGWTLHEMTRALEDGNDDAESC